MYILHDHLESDDAGRADSVNVITFKHVFQLMTFLFVEGIH